MGDPACGRGDRCSRVRQPLLASCSLAAALPTRGRSSGRARAMRSRSIRMPRTRARPTTCCTRSTSRCSSATRPASCCRRSPSPGRSRPIPTVWEFKLRQGVKFHNGNAVQRRRCRVLARARAQPTSDMKGLLTSIENVSKVDDHTVHIKTKGPNPLLPNYLTNLFMMDKEWSEANNTITVQDYKGKKDNFAVRNANGTGPYALVSREQDVRPSSSATRPTGARASFRSASPRSSISTIKADRHARRRAALGRGRLRAGRAGAGHRAAGEDSRASRSTSGLRTARSSSAWMSARRS